MQDWIAALFRSPELLAMGHHQRQEDLNLGLGWVYYALARVLRPTCIVVIGSWRGFTPLVFARALRDNQGPGEVVFIDPSLVDDFWANAAAVARFFAGHGAPEVRHYCMTTQEFVQSEAYHSLGEVGLLFVDGYHSREQAKLDFESFEPLLAAQAITLFHDTARTRTSRMYGEDRVYEHRVKDYVEELRARPDLQVFDLPFDSGVTLVSRRSGPA